MSAEGNTTTNNYLHNILVAAQSKQENMQGLDNVQSRLKTTGFRLKRVKCTFMTKSVTYLG